MTYKINQKSGIIQLLLLSLILLAVRVQAQDISIRDAISFQEKRESIAKESENAARLFDELIDGAPNAIFTIEEANEPEANINRTREGENILAIIAGFPDEALKLLDVMLTDKRFEGQLEHVRLISVKWDGESSFDYWKDHLEKLKKSFEQMKSLEYFFVQFYETGSEERERKAMEMLSSLSEILKHTGMHENVEILFRQMEQDR